MSITPAEAYDVLKEGLKLVEPAVFSPEYKEELYCNVPILKGEKDRRIKQMDKVLGQMDAEKLASGTYQIVMTTYMPVAGNDLRWPVETFSDAAFDISAIASMTGSIFSEEEDRDRPPYPMPEEIKEKLDRATKSLRATKYENPNVDLIREVVDWARQEEGLKPENLLNGIRDVHRPCVRRGVVFTKEREELDAPILFHEIWGGAGSVMATSQALIDNEQKLKDGSWLENFCLKSRYTFPEKNDKEHIFVKYKAPKL